jgi:hypothetical protein
MCVLLIMRNNVHQVWSTTVATVVTCAATMLVTSVTTVTCAATTVAVAVSLAVMVAVGWRAAGAASFVRTSGRQCRASSGVILTFLTASPAVLQKLADGLINLLVVRFERVLVLSVRFCDNMSALGLYYYLRNFL